LATVVDTQLGGKTLLGLALRTTVRHELSPSVCGAANGEEPRNSMTLGTNGRVGSVWPLSQVSEGRPMDAEAPGGVVLKQAKLKASFEDLIR
jgi:hypothetical protein